MKKKKIRYYILNDNGEDVQIHTWDNSLYT